MKKFFYLLLFLHFYYIRIQTNDLSSFFTKYKKPSFFNKIDSIDKTKAINSYMTYIKKINKSPTNFLINLTAPHTLSYISIQNISKNSILIQIAEKDLLQSESLDIFLNNPLDNKSYSVEIKKLSFPNAAIKLALALLHNYYYLEISKHKAHLVLEALFYNQTFFESSLLQNDPSYTNLIALKKQLEKEYLFINKLFQEILSEQQTKSFLNGKTSIGFEDFFFARTLVELHSHYRFYQYYHVPLYLQAKTFHNCDNNSHWQQIKFPYLQTHFLQNETFVILAENNFDRNNEIYQGWEDLPLWKLLFFKRKLPDFNEICTETLEINILEYNEFISMSDNQRRALKLIGALKTYLEIGPRSFFWKRLILFGNVMNYDHEELKNCLKYNVPENAYHGEIQNILRLSNCDQSVKWKQYKFLEKVIIKVKENYENVKKSLENCRNNVKSGFEVKIEKFLQEKTALYQELFEKLRILFKEKEF